MRRVRDDEGNIMIALLGVMVVTFIVVIGMTQMVLSEKVTRHDRNFEQALAAAETGLGKLVTQVRATPYATSVPAVSGSDSSTRTSYTATASGGAGHWTLRSTGTANGSNTSVSRTIEQKVDVTSLLAHPLFGHDSLTLGGGTANAVDTYDSSVGSTVCATDGSASSMGVSNVRMCSHATPAVGRVGTSGSLTMPGAALANMAGADIYDTGVAGYANATNLGKCVGDSSACSSAALTKYEDPLDFPLSSQCANGIGAGAAAYDGSLALAANAIYSFTDVTLNATAIANLANISGSTLVICFSGTLNVVPTVPLNTTTTSLVPLRLEPRAPSTLLLISTSGSGTPKVRLNAGLGLDSSLSAVIYAPNAQCTATAHVDLYGAMVCNTVSAPSGMTVHYDTQVGKIPFDQPVTVSSWREIQP